MSRRSPRRRPCRRPALPALIALALCLLGPAGAQQPAPVLADRDGDGLLDPLERRLAVAPADEPLSVLVVLDRPATRERVADLGRRLGGVTVTRRFELVDGFAARLRPAQVAKLATFVEVEHVEENATVRAAIDSAQLSFGTAKARMDAGVDGDGDGSPQGYSTGDLVAAVLDSGVAVSHQDLDEGKVIGWLDLVNGLDEPYDDFGHGTSVASVLAGEGDARPDRLYRGVAPGAALVGVKVLDRHGIGTVAQVVAGLEWVVAMKNAYGIEAVNLSLEQPGCANGTDALSLAVNAAREAGLVVVAAAGNGGPGTCTVGSPAAAAGAITVGAMADLGASGFRQAAFSSRGPTLDGRRKPDVSAPGVSIRSAASGTVAGYATQSGTSLAAPFVTGLALLMLDADPLLGPQGVADALTGTAVDWGRGGDGTVAGSRGPDIDYGAGRLDGYAAVEAAARRDIGSAPVAPGHILLEGALAAPGQAADFPLDVADATVPVAATLIIPALTGGQSSTLDFDLQLLDPAGAVVASAPTSKRQDDLAQLPAGPGRYVLRVRSVAGGGGFFVDVSAGLPVVPAEAPAVVELPTVSGSPRQGSTLTSTNGVWTGTPPLAHSRRWQRCDAAGAACGDIPGAAGAAYDLRAADVGARIRVLVRADNGAGAAEAASEPTAIVAPAPPRIASAAAQARRHAVTIRARTLRCEPCRVEARLRVRGSWVWKRMQALPGDRWQAVFQNVPPGRRAWRIRAVDLDSGLTAMRGRTVLVRRG